MKVDNLVENCQKFFFCANFVICGLSSVLNSNLKVFLRNCILWLILLWAFVMEVVNCGSKKKERKWKSLRMVTMAHMSMQIHFSIRPRLPIPIVSFNDHRNNHFFTHFFSRFILQTKSTSTLDNHSIPILRHHHHQDNWIYISTLSIPSTVRYMSS